MRRIKQLLCCVLVLCLMVAISPMVQATPPSFSQTIQRALKDGLITQTEYNSIHEDTEISRLQLARLLQRLTLIPSAGQASSFTDTSSLSTKDSDTVNAVVGVGYMQGIDNRFRPNQSAMMSDLQSAVSAVFRFSSGSDATEDKVLTYGKFFEELYKEYSSIYSGTSSKTLTGNVLLRDNTEFKPGTTIDGNLYIMPGVNTGNIALSGLKVTGTIYVDAPATITIGDCEYDRLVLGPYATNATIIGNGHQGIGILDAQTPINATVMGYPVSNVDPSIFDKYSILGRTWDNIVYLRPQVNTTRNESEVVNIHDLYEMDDGTGKTMRVKHRNESSSALAREISFGDYNSIFLWGAQEFTQNDFAKFSSIKFKNSTLDILAQYRTSKKIPQATWIANGYFVPIYVGLYNVQCMFDIYVNGVKQMNPGVSSGDFHMKILLPFEQEDDIVLLEFVPIGEHAGDYETLSINCQLEIANRGGTY